MNDQSMINPEYGLSKEDVQERIQKKQYNGVFKASTKTIGQIVFENVFTLFNGINFFLAVCVFFAGSYKNMGFLGVVFWNILIGIVQQVRSKKTIDRLSILSAPHVQVIREGKEEVIPFEEVCLDEILVIHQGDQVCADVKILKGVLSLNESNITGETNPISKREGDQVLSGTIVLSGSAVCIAQAVGEESFVNKIIKKTKYLKKPDSRIMASTRTIIRNLSIVIFPVGVILFLKYRYFMALSFHRSVVVTVSALVGMIPSGLMLLISCVFALATIKLGKKNVLVQELSCIETLARVDVLCLDKTGTLTEDKMYFENLISLMDDSEEVKKQLVDFAENMTDQNQTILAIRERFMAGKERQVTNRIPFDSKNKWSLISYKENESYILGAPDILLGNRKGDYEKLLKEPISQGKRILLFASCDYYDLPANDSIEKQELPKNILPLGFLVITEKLRPNVKTTLEYFKRQGVQLKIISGDNPQTVSNLAKQVEFSGTDFYYDCRNYKEGMDLREIAEKYNIFGRVTPAMKLALINALKESGHKVAMTGDGVNDVLALKEADCSIAMQSGSDAARSCSQLVLLDSDFSSMPEIVAEGRKSINNLERSAILYLEKTVYATLLAVIFVFLPVTYPLQAIQITVIGGLTIGIPSFLLALEPNYQRIKEGFLRNVLAVSIPSGVLVVLNIIATMIVANIFEIKDSYLSTLATYTTFAAAMIVIYHISQPFNRLKLIMIGLLMISFGVVTIVAYNLLDLANLKFLHLSILLIQGIASIYAYRLLLALSMKYFDWHYRKKENLQKRTSRV